ncbi:MAG TPA: L-dopachrome tautomerase-related protein, partial [Leptospiraceae bacterium]|nr:L-dopachrome tautomerase-related protein [Leptospiraceae bacterium]
HESVKPENYIAVVDGMRQTFFGILANQPGVDSIALDKKGQWLYYSAVTSEKLYRIHTSHLLNASMPAKELENKVEVFAMKSMSDGLTMDLSENIYISDMEHGAVNLLSPDKKLKTLLKDPVKIRWPDGFSFGPDGWLYFTCSSLQYVILKSRNSVQEKSPYQVYRFKPGHKGMPGQ